LPLLAATCAIAATLLLPAGAAAATSYTVAGSSIGLPAQVSLYETAATATYRLSTPAGEHPVELAGEMTAGANFGSGYLLVENAQGIVLRSVPVPAPTSISGQSFFTVSLAGLTTANGQTPLTLAIRGGNTPACTVPPHLTLTSLAVRYAGKPTAPTTIDSFFPSSLGTVTIYTSPTPTSAEEQAVTQLATALTVNYGAQSVQLKALPANGATPAAPASPFDRTVVVRQGPAAAVTVTAGSGGGAILQLTGDATSLPHQASLFASSLARLAHAKSATVNKPALPTTSTRASSYTFAQLNLSATLSVFGSQTVALPIDESQLGAGLSAITVHLIGAYTPIGPQGEGTLTASVQNIPLANLRLGSSGSFNTTFTIPHELLSRDTVIDLTADYSPGIKCEPDTPAMSLAVYPQSYLTVNRSTKLLGGFPSLPESFVKGMDVALQADTIAELNAAVQTVTGMQALTSVPLSPQIIPFAQAANSRVGTLIITNDAGIKQLGIEPPLGDSANQLSAALPGHPDVTVAGGFAAIESFADPKHGRNVLLITTSGGWGQLNTIFHAIATTGWYSLVGDTYASVAGGTPTDLTIRDSGVSTVTPPPTTSKTWQIIFIASGGVALAVLAFLVGLWRGRRRRKSGKKR
jgi:hypothetical protein